MYLHDLICTFGFATLASAAVAKQVPQPGWDKYAGERQTEHHQHHGHGHVHAREAEAEAEPAMKAAWEHAHGGPAATYKWTVPTGTHGFPTAWPTKVPQFKHHARDAMPEPEAEPGFGHHIKDPHQPGPHTGSWSHPTHTGSWTEPAAWKSWFSAHPHPTHHARDAAPEPEPGFQQHNHPTTTYHGPAPHATGHWTEPSAWKSWLTANAHAAHSPRPHHARDAEPEAEAGMMPDFQKWGEHIQHAGQKAGQAMGFKGAFPHNFQQHHARDAGPEAEAYKMHSGSFGGVPHGMPKPDGHHWARDVDGAEESFEGEDGYEYLSRRSEEDIDPSFYDFESNLDARDVEEDYEEPQEINFLARREADGDVDEDDEEPQEINFLARREADGEVEEDDEEPQEINFLARREADGDAEEEDEEPQEINFLARRDAEEDDEVPEEINFLARREADGDIEDDYEEPEAINFLARRDAEDESDEEPEEINFLARREADPRDAFVAGEGAHPELADREPGWVDSSWHRTFLASHGVQMAARDIEDAESEADFAHEAGLYDDAPVAAEYTAPPEAEETDIMARDAEPEASVHTAHGPEVYRKGHSPIHPTKTKGGWFW